MQQAKDLLYTDTNTHIESKSLNEVCEILAISPSTMRVLFHTHLGMSPRDYIIQQKMSSIKFLLRSTDMSISDIAVYVGYENFSKMSSRFKTHYGITPTQFRQEVKC